MSVYNTEFYPTTFLKAQDKCWRVLCRSDEGIMLTVRYLPRLKFLDVGAWPYRYCLRVCTQNTCQKQCWGRNCKGGVHTDAFQSPTSVYHVLLINFKENKRVRVYEQPFLLDGILFFRCAYRFWDTGRLTQAHFQLISNDVMKFGYTQTRTMAYQHFLIKWHILSLGSVFLAAWDYPHTNFHTWWHM